MVIGYIVIEGPGQSGLIVRQYAKILIEMVPGTLGWSWIQYDYTGKAVQSHDGFIEADGAKEAALNHFSGYWEERR